MMTKEYFNELLMERSCGYWNVCIDHGCSCALSGEGFDVEIYERMRKATAKEIEAEFQRDEEDYRDWEEEDLYDDCDEDIDGSYWDDGCSNEINGEVDELAEEIIKIFRDAENKGDI